MMSSAAPLPTGRRASSRSITALMTLTGTVFDEKPHQIVDLEAAVDTDRLEGADDLLDLAGLSERQQQALVGHVLAVGIPEHRDRIGRPLAHEAGAVAGRDTRVAVRTDRVVEIAVGPLNRIEMVVAVSCGLPRPLPG